jgi:hypothetical protein
VAERLVPLTLREPARGVTWGPEVAQMSGLEMLRANLEKRLPDAPITKTRARVPLRSWPDQTTAS